MVDVIVRQTQEEASGMGLSVLLGEFTEWFTGEAALMSRKDLAVTAEVIERLSRMVEHAQLIAAQAIDEQNLAGCGESEAAFAWDVPNGEKSEFRNTAEYLRARLGISKSEANRRLQIAANVLPRTGLTSQGCEAKYADLGAAVAGGLVSGVEATMISRALTRAQPVAEPETLMAMEQSLTVLATETDPDALARTIRVWEAHLDADGKEPSEEVLKAHQGAFMRGRRHGLNRLEIAATDEQFEYLMTVMNTAANPRTRPCNEFMPTAAPECDANAPGIDETGNEAAGIDGADAAGMDQRTRAQKLLDGLVGGCQLALATDKLPATGGHRPQIMVTIDYNELFAHLQHRESTNASGPANPSGPADSSGAGGTGSITGGAAFIYGGPVSASTVRKIACDADVIPVVLGGAGEILDLGRAKRLYTVKQRKALLARDRGCAFPGCTIPALWTEAHHVDYWSGHGHTDVNRGVLLCSFHHHLIHQGDWVIDISDGVPWFIPPAYLDIDQRPRRNHHFHPHRSKLVAPHVGSAQSQGRAANSPGIPLGSSTEAPAQRVFNPDSSDNIGCDQPVDGAGATATEHGEPPAAFRPHPSEPSAAGTGWREASNQWIGADGPTEPPSWDTHAQWPSAPSAAEIPDDG